MAGENYLKVTEERKIEEVLKDLVLIFGNIDRYRIMCILDDKKLDLGELAARSGKERAEISYHLRKLQDGGFVGQEYEILEKPADGKSGKVHTVFGKTDRANNVMPFIQLVVNDMVKRYPTNT